MNGKQLIGASQESNEVTYIVLDIDSDQCERTVSDRLLTNPHVDAVVVDPETRGVTVHGHGLDVMALRASIETAGYPAA